MAFGDVTILDWRGPLIYIYFLNSVITTLAVIAGVLTTSVLAAYALTHINLPGRDFFFLAILATIMIPNDLTLVPKVVMMFQWGWYNTYAALIVPFLVSVFGIFLLRQFFLTLPRELEDAAKIDGCSRLTFFRLVLLPLSKPALAAVGIFTFLHNWNSYLWPLIVTSTTSMRTLPVGLRFFVAQEGATQWTLLMAASVFVMAPVLLVFLLAQRYFIEGVSITGLKG